MCDGEEFKINSIHWREGAKNLDQASSLLGNQLSQEGSDESWECRTGTPESENTVITNNVSEEGSLSSVIVSTLCSVWSI